MMIKYITLTTSMVQSSLTSAQKILFGVLSVLTRKGTVPTTVSNKYLGEVMGVKSESQVSSLLMALKKNKLISVNRKLGRRQISLNTKELIEGGYLAELRKK